MRLQLSAPPPINLNTRNEERTEMMLECSEGCDASCLAINKTKDLLNAVDPRHELEGGACGGVALDVRLGSTVHRVEDDQSILRPSILSERRVTVHSTNTQENTHESQAATHVSSKVCFSRRTSVKVPAVMQSGG